MIYFSLTINLILIIFLSLVTYGLWIKYAKTNLIRGFLLPGTIVHELSHALMCLITGTTIKELNLFSPGSTGIKYDKPRIRFVFDFIIVSAPFFGCAFLIFLITKLLSNPIHFNSSFHESHFTFGGFFALLRHMADAVWITFNTLLNQLHLGEIRHIIFLLAIIIFTVSMSPQKQDIKHLIIGFILLSFIFFFLGKVNVHLLRYGWWNFCIEEFWLITVLTVSVLVPLLLITLIIMGFTKGYMLAFGQKGKSKGAGKDNSNDARNANKGDRK
ncbi:MAG TPA: hypothetical protein VI727_08915 [Candidatus Brocadiaceae bacterium]|nr:hypothetical protein [Candidatus Brocadiaceae bacterium]